MYNLDKQKTHASWQTVTGKAQRDIPSDAFSILRAISYL
jgi:hypothetical protein